MSVGADKLEVQETTSNKDSSEEMMITAITAQQRFIIEEL